MLLPDPLALMTSTWEEYLESCRLLLGKIDIIPRELMVREEYHLIPHRLLSILLQTYPRIEFSFQPTIVACCSYCKKFIPFSVENRFWIRSRRAHVVVKVTSPSSSPSIRSNDLKMAAICRQRKVMLCPLGIQVRRAKNTKMRRPLVVHKHSRYEKSTWRNERSTNTNVYLDKSLSDIQVKMVTIEKNK